MRVSAPRLVVPGVSNAARERKIAAVVAYSPVGDVCRSASARVAAGKRFEGYLRSRPLVFLDDLYRSLPAFFRGGARRG